MDYWGVDIVVVVWLDYFVFGDGVVMFFEGYDIGYDLIGMCVVC